MIKLFKTILLTIIVTVTANAGVKPTSGRYIESNTDLSIQTINENRSKSVKYKKTSVDDFVHEYYFFYSRVEEFRRPGYFWSVSVNKKSCETTFYPGK